jgi:hypothetical protein
MIRFACECGKELQAREESGGKLVRCPACQRQLTVPDESPPSDAEPESRVQPERPLRREEPEWEEERATSDRPRRQPAGSSGKAVSSLILGILSLLFSFLTGLPALILGILALREIGRSRGRLSGNGLAIGGIVTACVCSLLNCGLSVSLILPALLVPAVQKVREAADRAQSQNNLRQMSLAMLNYCDTHMGTMPPAAIGDPGKPPAQRRALLSWRVAILPYIHQQGLYNQFKLDEPWDGPNNIRLLGQMPMVYKLTSDSATPSGHTHYQVFVGNGAAFEKTRGLRVPGEFPDGFANTLLIVEAARAVPWTKPEDIAFDPNKPIKPFLDMSSPRGCNVVLADGSVMALRNSISDSTLKIAIIRNDGLPLPANWWER